MERTHTLADLLGRFQLYALCVPCERMEKLPLEKLVVQQGAETTVDQIRSRIRCQQCQQRRADIRIVYVGPNCAASGFHYR